MTRFLLPISAALLCAALLLSPIIAALPDDTTPQQSLWASALSACVFLSAVLCLLVPVPSVSRLAPARDNGALPFAALIVWAGVSLLARLATHGSVAYLGLMLRGLTTWATFGAAFALCIHLARQGRAYVYALIGTVFVASAYVANNGLREYLFHRFQMHEMWRVFGTSTPDFLAAYFVLLIPVTLAVLLRVPSGRELKSPLLGDCLAQPCGADPAHAGHDIACHTVKVRATQRGGWGGNVSIRIAALRAARSRIGENSAYPIDGAGGCGARACRRGGPARSGASVQSA